MHILLILTIKLYGLFKHTAILLIKISGFYGLLNIQNVYSLYI